MGTDDARFEFRGSDVETADSAYPEGICQIELALALSRTATGTIGGAVATSDDQELELVDAIMGGQ